MEEEKQLEAIEWDAEFYNQNSQTQFENAIALINQIDLSKATGFLDVGCGTGHLALYVAKKYPHLPITGYDASANMIKKAEENLIKAREQDPNLNIHFFQANAMQHRFETPHYSHAISLSVFHFIKNHLQALKNIATALSDGGNFLLVTAANSQNSAFGDAFIETAHSEQWLTYFPPSLNLTALACLTTKDELMKKCKQAGFVNIDIQEITRHRQFDSKKNLIQFLLGWTPALPIVNKLTHVQRILFINDVAYRYFEKMPAQNGYYTYSVPSLIARAQVRRDEFGKIISDEIF